MVCSTLVTPIGDLCGETLSKERLYRTATIKNLRRRPIYARHAAASVKPGNKNRSAASCVVAFYVANRVPPSSENAL
jgi:hypothetical protein